MLLIRGVCSLNIDKIFNIPKIKNPYYAAFIGKYYSLSSFKQYGYSVETGQPKFANRLLRTLILHQQARRGTLNAEG